MFSRQNSTASGNPVANAFHNEGNKIAGENGEIKLRSSNNTLVDMFTLITSGTNTEEIFRRVNDFMKHI